MINLTGADGVKIPALGFGTFRLNDETCVAAVGAALQTGYRHIDTAAMYGNEREVGEALRASGVARDAVFVTTKVWHSDLRRADFLRSTEASLKRLDIGAVDLLLVHWPDRAAPLDETMAALSQARRSGYTRHIGVANFPSALFRQACALADAPLVCNQCEYHPRLDQSAVRAACAEAGAIFTAYSPLGKGDLVNDPALTKLAHRLGRSAPQVILRWHLQQGVAAISRSQSPAHIAANFDIFDFALDDAAMAEIDALRSARERFVNPAFAPDWDDPSRMFYFFAKTFGFIVHLPHLLMAGALLGIVLTWRARSRRWGVRIASFFVVVLAAVSFLPVSAIVVRPLEERFPQPDLSIAPTGVIVLGGAVEEGITRRRGLPALNEAAERMTEGAALARRFPQARLVFAGGTAVFRNHDMTESDVARKLWVGLGVDPDRMMFEDRSRDTWENATNLQAMFHPKPGERWLLVTSAMHMPRAMGIFRKIGFPVDAYPVDYRTGGGPGDFVGFRKMAGSLLDLEQGTHEWVGLLVYYLSGKTSALFPAP